MLPDLTIKTAVSLPPEAKVPPDITLEKMAPCGPGQDYPVCVQHKGDSPVEDWSGDDPAGSWPFSPAEVNRELAMLGRAKE